MEQLADHDYRHSVIHSSKDENMGIHHAVVGETYRMLDDLPRSSKFDSPEVS